MQLAAIDLATPRDHLLFRTLVKTKLGYKLQDFGGLSYTRAHEIVLEILEEACYNKGDFCLHSRRSGGASAAARAGVPDRLFKRHGRWRSENTKDGYVKDTPPDQLSVEKGIGICDKPWSPSYLCDLVVRTDYYWSMCLVHSLLVHAKGVSMGCLIV